MSKDVIRQQTKDAVSRGIIKVPNTCEDCGAVAVLECHHKDYENPLDVAFLCPTCHTKRHLKGKMPLIAPTEKHCLRCGHTWAPRVEVPTCCPRCKSPSWDKPRTRRHQASRVKAAIAKEIGYQGPENK